jgi:hypothetical protein
MLGQESHYRQGYGIAHGGVSIVVRTWDAVSGRGPHERGRLRDSQQSRREPLVLFQDNDLPAASARRRSQASREAVKPEF